MNHDGKGFWWSSAKRVNAGTAPTHAMSVVLNPPPSPHHWSRGFRPLFWWLLLVLIFFGIRMHQRLIAETRLAFSIAVQGQPDSGATATLDGKRIQSGQLVSLGGHQLVITRPKAELFSTNLFIWYGEHNLGEINLMRNRGALNILANPPAAIIIVIGPEVSLMLSNVSITNLTLPTDQYEIRAQYPHWTQTNEITVSDQNPVSCSFLPRLGAVHITCNHEGATYGLTSGDGQTQEGGTLPATATDLPPGEYQMSVVYHHLRTKKTVAVKAGETKETAVEFNIGAVRLDIMPYGAIVATLDRNFVGITPLELSDVPVGHTNWVVELAGFAPVQLAMTVVADQTNEVSTNLVRLDYVNAITEAKQNLADGHYHAAFMAITNALAIKPGDPVALALNKSFTIDYHFQQVDGFVTQSNYSAAVTELKAVLALEPENAKASQLMSDYEKLVPAQVEQEQSQQRILRPQEVFDTIAGQYTGAVLFDQKTISTTKPVKAVAAALAEAMTNTPAWVITLFAFTEKYPDVFVIEAKQTYASGYRTGIIVGGQTKDDETQILFKVLEYESSHQTVLQSLLPKNNVQYELMTSSSSDPNDVRNERIREGVQRMADKIQQVVGQ